MPNARSRRQPAHARTDEWYDHPTWYDVLHAAGTAEEVDGLERIACTHCRTPSRGLGRWLEPACGTGRYLRVAAGRGIDVVGIDASEPMIDYARARFDALGLGGDLRVGDMTDFRISPKVDFAFCLINSIRHLPSDRAMLDHLRCIADSLRRGGVYAVGISLAKYGIDEDTEDVWEAQRGRLGITQLIQYLAPDPDTRAERVVSQLRITTPSGERDVGHTYNLRSYDHDQWLALLRRSAMEPVALCNEWGEEIARPEDRAGAGAYGVWILAPRR